MSACAVSSLPVVVLTGGSSGIGAEVAKLIIRSGSYRIAILARRLDALQAVISEAHGTAENSLAIQADMTDRAQVTKAANQVVAQFGRIDVWINNAGRGIWKATSALGDADLEDMMKINVNSALYGMQEALRVFRSQEGGRGHIINVSSLLGRNAAMAPMLSAYSGAKHFLNALTESLRGELKTSDPNIVVSTFSPGVVATDFGAHHDGPDSRTMPHAQEVGEVAAGIVGVIESRVEEQYSRAMYQGMITGYFAAMAAPAGAVPASAPAH